MAEIEAAPPEDGRPEFARRLGMARSTVGLILRRLGLVRLALVEPRPPIVRHERDRPGETINLDIKKLGRIGVGHRFTGRGPGTHNLGRGCDFVHVCVDDASRLAYTELLPSEGQHDAKAFLERPLAWLDRDGVRVERVMTDDGSAYRSRLFGAAFLKAGGVTSEIGLTHRAAAITPWTDDYNLNRPHSGIKGITPWKRVTNLLGNEN